MGSLGSYLRRERELKQISVAELAQTTRIPVRLLHQIENDDCDALPADVFVRGFLRSYARALGIDEEQVLARFRGRQTPEPPPALPAVYTPESGRRFGIAIALFILLILFTLALSIVLRPRQRDTPLELSSIHRSSAPMAQRMEGHAPLPREDAGPPPAGSSRRSSSST